MRRARGPADAWPAWLEALRPGAEARRRMKEGIRVRSRPLLWARRSPRWQDVAAGWAGLLVPLTAAAALAFVVIAYGAARPAPDRVATVEELVRPGEADEPPEVLTAASEPSAERVLRAVIDYQAP